MGRRTLLSTLGQRSFVRVRKLSSGQRAAKDVFARAEAAGWKPGAFPTPGEAQAFLDKAASSGEQPRDEKGRFASK